MGRYLMTKEIEVNPSRRASAECAAEYVDKESLRFRQVRNRKSQVEWGNHKGRIALAPTQSQLTLTEFVDERPSDVLVSRRDPSR